MKNFLVSILGVVVVGVLAGYGLSWFLQDRQEPEETVVPVVEEQLPPRLVQLYFVDPAGTSLVLEGREIAGCDDENMCIKGVLDALIEGSQQGFVDVLPKETQVLDVTVENDLVRANFSRHLADFHPGGNLSELLTVYSLIDTLNENFSYLRQAQILIEGEVRQTLKGHARIDQPVYVDFGLTQAAAVDNEENRQDGLSVEDLIDKAVH